MSAVIAGVVRIGQGGLEESGLEVFGWGARYLPTVVGDSRAGDDAREPAGDERHIQCVARGDSQK